MPAKSKAQADLMRAAEHGATFPLARKVASTMSRSQMHDFAVGSTKGKPAHVGQHPHQNLGAYLHAPKKKSR